MLKFIEILENHQILSFGIIACFSILLIVSILQKKANSVNLVIYKRINVALILIIYLLIIIIGFLPENRDRFWTLLLLIVFYLLQYFFPKLRKWYDNKIDGLGDKLSDKYKEL